MVVAVDSDPSFLFNKDTNEVIFVEDLEGGGVRISRYRHDRVIYEDREANTETVSRFVEIMDDLEDQGFRYVDHSA